MMLDLRAFGNSLILVVSLVYRTHGNAAVQSTAPGLLLVLLLHHHDVRITCAISNIRRDHRR